MTGFGWMTLALCCAAGLTACTGNHTKAARFLGCCACGLCLIGCGALLQSGAFADFAAVPAKLWLHAGGALGGTMVFGLLLLGLIPREWKE